MCNDCLERSFFCWCHADWSLTIYSDRHSFLFSLFLLFHDDDNVAACFNLRTKRGKKTRSSSTENEEKGNNNRQQGEASLRRGKKSKQGREKAVSFYGDVDRGMKLPNEVREKISREGLSGSAKERRRNEISCVGCLLCIHSRDAPFKTRLSRGRNERKGQWAWK